ncbi:hypothetical protein D3C81_770390 [compost metagenome]
MMISFNRGSSKFNFRTACIVIQNSKVLFQQTKGQNHWFLPGGRVEFHEDSLETISREIQEEFGLEVYDKTLVWIVENFFDLEGIKFHEIGFYYLITIDQIMDFSSEIGIEDGFVTAWIELDHLNEYNIVPDFLKEELKKITLAEINIKHIIVRA